MLKAAVIGCGRMGAAPSQRLEGSVPGGWLPISHAESLQRVDGVELVALCDVDAARLESCGRHYGVAALYTDYRLLLTEVRPDVVAIATRTPGKAAILIEACALGAKAIYVEKPLANSLADCRRALDAAANAGAVVAYGVNRRYHAVYRRARTLLEDGIVGEIREISAEFGRSQLLWAHPHSVDLMQFYHGDVAVIDAQAVLAPDSVVRSAERVIDSDPLIEHACFTFESGVRATIGRSGGCNLRIGGTRGALTIHADGAYIQVSRPRAGNPSYFMDQELVVEPPPPSATVTAMSEMVAAIGGRQAPPIAPAEIERGLSMLMACVWSHLQANRPVRLHEVPADLVVTGKYLDRYA